MSTLPRPPIDCEHHYPSVFAPNIPAAVDFYTKRLGFDLGFTWGDPPRMAGVTLDRVQIFLEQGTPQPAGASLYFVVGHADSLCEYHRANGVEIVVPPGDRDYGLRDYRVHDLHGYSLSFGHNLFIDGPPIEVERVDVPLRIEKRLAALLRDLADYKHLSLTSCVEEILLHTNEPLGDGVASPHTRGQLRHIQELKKKHGIDYDSHGSYRFVERS